MTSPVSQSTDAVPVLRWIYSRAGRRVFCELSLDADRRVYQLRTDTFDRGHRPQIEQFADVTPAFLRHGQLEAELIRGGWTLEFYERLQPTLH